MIRKYNYKDLASIDEIGSQIKSSFNETYNIASLNNDYANIYVYEENNDVIGFLHYEEHYEIADIINIAVAINKHNKGIGKSLIKYLIDNTKSEKIMLEVRENNISAINLYQKCGFIEINRRKRYYGEEDAIIMERSTI